jgi:glucoamylase
MSSSPPGHPGAPPRWTSSAKDGVGTAVNPACRVWFTLAEGIVTEVYHPYIDHATVRDFGLLLTDGRGFFSEEKSDTNHKIEPVEQGVPGFRLINTCRQGRYRMTKTVITDPSRDVLLQRVRFEALKGAFGAYTLHALLAPHIGNHGHGNSGWVSDYRGLPLLFAERRGTVLALGCSHPWSQRSCGYVGTSDGWQDLRKHGRMEWDYSEARDGNIALTGALDLSSCGGEFTLALGFGRTPEEAGQQVRASLLCDFDERLEAYRRGWRSFQQECRDLPGAEEKNGFDLIQVSTSVLRTHGSKRFSGGLIASLSIPWGAAHGDQDLGGYHVVWPRDLVQTAGAMLAMGHPKSARVRNCLWRRFVRRRRRRGRHARRIGRHTSPGCIGASESRGRREPAVKPCAFCLEGGVVNRDEFPIRQSAAPFLFPAHPKQSTVLPENPGASGGNREPRRWSQILALRFSRAL